MMIWHVELTSRCTLRCPKCTRTLSPNSYTITDLSYNDFIKFFDGEMMKRDLGFLFAGRLGDPIYHPQLFAFIDYIKKYNKPISIETNGSYRPKPWWKILAGKLAKNDTLTFSVDGLEDTNHVYRINSRWEDIIAAMNVCSKRKFNVQWKFIIFKHNQHQIDEAKEIAQSLGFKFIAYLSHRYDKEDFLKPDNKYISPQVANLEDLENNQSERVMKPICQRETMFFISATGHFRPCCWIIACLSGYHPHPLYVVCLLGLQARAGAGALRRRSG